MAEISAQSVVFMAGGAATGAGVSATVGGMGLAGGFGAFGIGMAPVTVAGAVAGAAAYGAFCAIAEFLLVPVVIKLFDCGVGTPENLNAL